MDDHSETPAEKHLDHIEDERLTVIRHDENKGVSAARNRAIKESNGEYLALLDDDDRWLEDKIQKQIDFLEKQPNSVKGCYTGSIVESERGDKEVIPRRYSDLKYQILMMNARGAFGSTLMVSKDAVLEVGTFKEDMERNEDWELLVRILEKYELLPIQESLIVRDIGRKNVQPKKSVEIKRKFLEEIKEALEGLNWVKRRKVYSIHYLQLSWLFSWASKKPKAVYYLSIAISYHPLPKARATGRAAYYLFLPSRFHPTQSN